MWKKVVYLGSMEICSKKILLALVYHPPWQQVSTVIIDKYFKGYMKRRADNSGR